MNILFSTQSVGLKIFYHLLGEIERPLGITKVGFYVSQSMYYSRFVRRHSDLEAEYTVVKEWEIVEASRKLKPDLDKIRAYEKAIGNPTLWDAVICDRRIYLGKQCKVKQDYCPSFSHEQMLSILQVALETLERLLDQVKPDVVLSLDPVTLGDYLLYLFCEARNIPMLFFRTTKIGNYVELNEGVFGCSPHIYRAFQEYEKDNLSDQWTEQAEAYLERVREENVRYEGMVLIPSKRKRSKSRTSLVRSLIKGLRVEKEYLLKHRKDHCIRGIVVPFAYAKLLSPLRARLHSWQYSRHYVLESQLGSIDFAFYPLQSEPEISSLIWGKSYMNHIEAIRNIGRSLPVGMKLLVKEHPRALGYRSSGYYKKLMEVPNVLMAHPDQEVRPIIRKSKMVISIATFVGFEAAIFQKPSIMLGGPRPFCILPDSMVRYVHSVNDLASEIADLLENYEYKERPLVNYIAATMKGSVAIDYFTTLLGKKGRHGDSGIGGFDEEIKKMASYTADRIVESLNATREMAYV